MANNSPNIPVVKKYIQQNIAAIESWLEVAESLNCCYETLRKNFRNAEGITIGQFIKIQKIKLAKELLETTDLLCYQVAYQVGFRNPVTCFRLFKEYTGFTMKEYRFVPEKFDC